MILKMTDRSEMFVDAKEGAAIRASLTKSAEGFITVRGTTIKKSGILKLEEGGVDPRASLFDSPEHKKALAMGSCRGERSLAKELMRVASIEKNFKLLSDQQWRKDTEADLRASGMKFCNTKTGECACKPEKARV